MSAVGMPVEQSVDELFERWPGEARLVDPEGHQSVQPGPEQGGGLVSLGVVGLAHRGENREESLIEHVSRQLGQRQVVEHLQSHLSELPASDLRSREVVERMRDDEARHGAAATDSGARDLPASIRRLMRHTARVMTRTAHRI